MTHPMIPSGRKGLIALFSATILLSAGLLFFVQPLFTKITLPVLGGAPAVWTTAMLFFQSTLIAGYTYAHLSNRYLPLRVQVIAHLALWASALLFLPLGLRSSVSFDGDASISAQTLWLFATGVGVPFIALAANAPLIQTWYRQSGGPSADDPYFLYGASNLGSLSALLAFPLIAEPLFGIRAIGFGWAAGFVVLGAGLALTGWMAITGPGQAGEGGDASAVPTTGPTAGPAGRAVATWLFLAFLPSSLMLTVTSKISADFGALPLIWVVPLALYLLTFVLAFSQSGWLNTGRLGWVLALGLAVLASIVAVPGRGLSGAYVLCLLLAFFAIALVAHRALYQRRPGAEHLTFFYMIMSIGGSLGGIFNSLIAPNVFDDLYEVQITAILALGLWFLLGQRPSLTAAMRDAGVGLVVALPIAGAWVLGWPAPIEAGHVYSALALGYAMVVLYWFRDWMRGPLVLAPAGIVLLGLLQGEGDVVFRDRSFFGTHTVVEIEGQRSYLNGTTRHGAQFIADDGAARPRPLTYYGPRAPMGQILSSARGQAARDVGIVGLGVGSLACLAGPEQRYQFYEIDVMVEVVARTPALFGFMPNCAEDAPTHLGDARVVLEAQENLRYDILVIDAYSSNAIPVHLTTTEAIELFLARLKPGGLLVLHITNRYYDVAPPMARAAATLGLAARIQEFKTPGKETGLSSSTVAILGADEAALAPFADDPRWAPLVSDGRPAWTDDHANVLSALK